jgi:hypothetical protein
MPLMTLSMAIASSCLKHVGPGLRPADFLALGEAAGAVAVTDSATVASSSRAAASAVCFDLPCCFGCLPLSGGC